MHRPYQQEKKLAFRNAFAKKTKATKHKIRPPKFTLEDIEDFYTFYVLILGIPEDIFWNCDVSFVMGVAENKRAYDAWLNYTMEVERDKARSK